MQENLDYMLQYSNWHKETLSSRAYDIEQWNLLINTHKLLPEDKNAKILEAGCGMGRFLLKLKELGYYNQKGIDINSDFIQISQKENLNVEKEDIIRFLEKTEETFDVIYCFDLAEHLPKEKQPYFFKLINTHLNNNGFAVIRVPNALSPTANFFRYEDFTHVTSYTPITLDFLCKNAGFDYITTRPDVKECLELRRLKVQYAEIYRKQFGLDNLILTPNLLTIAFKDKDVYENYLKQAPLIDNNYNYDYEIEYLNLKQLVSYYLIKFCTKISIGPIKNYFKSKLPGKYEIVVKKTDNK